MIVWIAGTRHHNDDVFLFGAYRTEEEARAVAERHTIPKLAVPLLYECTVGETESKGLLESYELPDPISD